jgi:hypothetical protein
LSQQPFNAAQGAAMQIMKNKFIAEQAPGAALCDGWQACLREIFQKMGGRQPGAQSLFS